MDIIKLGISLFFLLLCAFILLFFICANILNKKIENEMKMKDSKKKVKKWMSKMDVG